MTRVRIPRPDADRLPPVCCVCGRPAEQARAEKLSWTPPWVSWLLLLFFAPAFVYGSESSFAKSLFSVLCGLAWPVALLTARRSAALALPVCERHARRSRRAWVVLFGGLLLATGLGVTADQFVPDATLRSQLTVSAVLLGGFSVLAAVMARDDRVRAAGIDPRSVTLERVSREFAEAVTGGERGPGPRAAAPGGGVVLASARYYRG
jgi:hypothetical protein